MYFRILVPQFPQGVIANRDSLAPAVFSLGGADLFSPFGASSYVVTLPKIPNRSGEWSLRNPQHISAPSPSGEGTL